MGNVIILGSQWGDEGKGKIVDLFSDRFDIVARYQGGHNAGHTVFIGEKKFVLKLIPSGILRPGKQAVIGNGLVIDPAALLAEIESLESAGVEVTRVLAISNRAHVLFPSHRMMERMSEGRPGRVSIGTTSRGIGPCYEDKIARRGIRIADLLNADVFRPQFDSVMEEKAVIAKALGIYEELDLPAIRDQYEAFAERIRPMVRDTALFLNQAISAGKTVMFEGAQGTMLDIDHGTYPFVTSSSASAGGACTGTGVPPTRIHGVIGVSKAYITRVGGGPFPTEALDGAGDEIRARGNEFGAVTGPSAALRLVRRAAAALHLRDQRLRQRGDHQAGCAGYLRHDSRVRGVPHCGPRGVRDAAHGRRNRKGGAGVRMPPRLAMLHFRNR